MIKIKTQEYNILHSKPRIVEGSKNLKEFIEYFLSKGTKLIFYTIPVEKSLKKLPRYQQEKEVLDSIFRPYNLPVINEFDDYKTTDGEHLTGQEIRRFSKELALKLK